MAGVVVIRAPKVEAHMIGRIVKLRPGWKTISPPKRLGVVVVAGGVVQVDGVDRGRDPNLTCLRMHRRN